MNVGIAGGGLLGRLLGFELVNRGYHVTLFDKDEENGSDSCGMVAAGLLSSLTELDKCDLVINQLGQAAFEYWPRVINQLGNNIYFRHNGCLALSHPKDSAELTRFINLISSKIDIKNCCHQLKENEISQFEPELSKFDNGYYFADEGHLDNQALLSSLYAYLLHISNKSNKKLDWFSKTMVEDVKPGKIITQNKVMDFDFVFDCRGLGAKSNFTNLRGIRGELIWLYAPDVCIQRPIRLLHPRYSLYLVPRLNNIYIIGASEIESEENSSISVRTTLELLSAAYYLHAGFIEARVIKTAVQCRPTLSDHLPKIRYTDRMIAVNGLYRHGFLIAPALINDIICYLEKSIFSVRFPQIWEKWNDQNFIK